MTTRRESLTHAWTSESADQTRALGRRLGALLRSGDFVGLVGELGAGKTELVRGLAEGVGVSPEDVTSPSFALVNEYPGRIKLYHADLYRLGDADELYAIGWEDVLQSEDGAVVVEWLDRVPRAAPEELLLVRLADAGPDRRRIEVSAHGERAAELLRAWAGA